MTKEIRSPNVEGLSVVRSPVSSLGFRHSFGFRHSSFGFVKSGSWKACFRFLLLKIAVVLAFAGCTHSPPEADLVIINGAEPESLDPAVLTGEADGRIALELSAGLTRYDPTDATPIPDLAESWDLSADGKVYTFHLRTNAVWSTGEPITAGGLVS